MQEDAEPESFVAHRGDPALRKGRDRQQARQRREMLRAAQDVGRKREKERKRERERERDRERGTNNECP